jgi:hypothetical protein
MKRNEYGETEYQEILHGLGVFLASGETWEERHPRASKLLRKRLKDILKDFKKVNK